jgi:hypothetical protein
MKASLGSNWQDFFNIIITKCKKPLFFAAENPFAELQSDSPLSDVKSITEAVKRNKVIQNGNSKMLTEYLKEVTGIPNLKIVSFGEHLYNHMLAAFKFNKKTEVTWDTIALCEEFSMVEPKYDEGVEMGVINHCSQTWGLSYFADIERSHD